MIPLFPTLALRRCPWGSGGGPGLAPQVGQAQDGTRGSRIDPRVFRTEAGPCLACTVLLLKREPPKAREAPWVPPWGTLPHLYLIQVPLFSRTHSLDHTHSIFFSSELLVLNSKYQTAGIYLYDAWHLLSQVVSLSL